MRHCRACKTPKWGTDPCTNPVCPRVTGITIRLKGRSLPITATAKHGFHGTNTSGFVQPTSDYDSPIRAQGWRTIA